MAATNSINKITSMPGWWVLYSPSGIPELASVSHSREMCISQYISDSSYAWSDWEAKGWSCEMVNIKFEIATPETILI